MRCRSTEIENIAEVDTTPLMDVVFILLIFFLVTSSYVREVGIGVHTSAQHAQTSGGSRPVIVLVRADGVLMLEDTVVTRSAMITRLRAVSSNLDHVGVTVISHPKATTGMLVSALDGVRLAGIQNPFWKISGTDEMGRSTMRPKPNLI